MSNAAKELHIADLASGDKGIISSLAATASAVKRLTELGFVRGMRLEMLHPGIPCIVRIDESRIGLGKDLQKMIRLNRG